MNNTLENITDENILIKEIARKIKDKTFNNSSDFETVITSFVNSQNWELKANELYKDISTVGTPIEANKEKVIEELKKAEADRLFKEVWKELKGFRK